MTQPTTKAVSEMSAEELRSNFLRAVAPGPHHTMLPTAIECFDELLRRLSAQPPAAKAAIALRIYRNVPCEGSTIECSVCNQHILMGTPPICCPACGVKFTDWQDSSVDKGQPLAGDQWVEEAAKDATRYILKMVGMVGKPESDSQIDAFVICVTDIICRHRGEK